MVLSVMLIIFTSILFQPPNLSSSLPFHLRLLLLFPFFTPPFFTFIFIPSHTFLNLFFPVLPSTSLQSLTLLLFSLLSSVSSSFTSLFLHFSLLPFSSSSLLNSFFIAALPSCSLTIRPLSSIEGGRARRPCEPRIYEL